MLIAIDERDQRPLYLQIAAQVKEQVQQGELRPGDELPPVRELAGSLGINLHTVRSAYLRLRDQGVIDLRLGRRARIAQRQQAVVTPSEAERTLGAQVRELVADAFLLGLSTDDLHALLDRHAAREDSLSAKQNRHPEERS